MSARRCADWYRAQRRSSGGEIRKPIHTSSGARPAAPSLQDIMMLLWPWAKLEWRAVCAEKCTYGSGRRSAFALLTPLWTAEGWLYLAIVLDLFSRRIIGWAMSDRMKKGLAIEALQRAIARRNPPPGLIHHSDRGSQYCSDAYRKLATARGFTLSMSGRGNCYGNAMVETVFKTIKSELIWRTAFRANTRQEQMTLH